MPAMAETTAAAAPQCLWWIKVDPPLRIGRSHAVSTDRRIAACATTTGTNRIRIDAIRQPDSQKPAKEVWRVGLLDGWVHVCELGNDATVGAGWDFPDFRGDRAPLCLVGVTANYTHAGSRKWPKATISDRTAWR